jgi:hypothetical protein
MIQNKGARIAALWRVLRARARIAFAQSLLRRNRPGCSPRVARRDACATIGEGTSTRRLRNSVTLALLALASPIIPADQARGDDFSRITGPFLGELLHRADAHTRASLTLAELDNLPEVLPRARAAFLLVKTDEGNAAKLLVSSGLRKPKPGAKPPALVPVLVLERLETLDGTKYLSFKARGKEIVLFGEFAFDLDSGQVVPEGMGGDIVFTAAGGDGPRLVTLGDARLCTFDRSVLPPAVARGRPSSGRTVEPGDFAGSYQLFANGQWSGKLEIEIKEGTEVAGRFRSDLNGSVYPVSGTVAADKPQRIGFTIQFPRAEQVYDGLLWTEGKNVIAGNLAMLERPYSFVAIRDGASLASSDLAVEPSQDLPKRSGHRVVVVLQENTDRVVADGRQRMPAELADALTEARSSEAATEVLLRVPADIPFERINAIVETIRKAGIDTIRVAPAVER